ncbi:uncharacterized protein ACA1_149760 [Acanthamoeba castellanii str. Neff]|uniref:Uncharacterized protein n=1 Tax=Acanthamoeba castellanii (strain ATCC 30010 / Neff) TaxID=1257118 RepID=L8HDF1_ACACF|nr:uncharacterized protein ACA1_149760 [Acanthamoeba castellanii str. Neff]ELR22788.1 hypothetical protein ACA1_149760 [Acanthamoeba castellanii str. Neff]
MLVQDIAKFPKLMAYKKPSLIKRWNLKWEQEQELEQEQEQGQKPTTLTLTNCLTLGHFPLSTLVLMWIGVNTKLCLSNLYNF